MAEDLAKQLAGYKAQLQQVESALTANGENEDLLKLKKDLQEVIELTKDLLSSQPSETADDACDDMSASGSQSWKVGEKCMAVWSDDGQKEMIAAQREYKKKKALKKAQRIKELEQEREDQKVKWQQFNNKAYSKNKKGQVKRSIFASPESVTGKVGVGTCGIADKPMTQYQDTSKYNVRHLMPQ
uniref:Survival of motor neuron-related-splicing factor 30 n=1 Tax=Xenopus tropicalis TaxID=8364 RepID=A0A1B8Y718_XENTR